MGVIEEEYKREGGDEFPLWGAAQEASAHAVAPRSLSYVMHPPLYWCGGSGNIHSAVLRWPRWPWLISGC